MISLNVKYESEPAAFQYVLLPDGRADVWLRRNIKPFFDSENELITHIADEAYMRTDLSPEAISNDFDASFDAASRWTPWGGHVNSPSAEPNQTLAQRVRALESENQDLLERLETTMAVVDYLLLHNNHGE